MRYDSSIENKCFHTIFEKQHEWGTKHYLIDLFDEFERKNGYSTELNHVGFTSGVLNPLVA